GAIAGGASALSTSSGALGLRRGSVSLDAGGVGRGSRARRGDSSGARAAAPERGNKAEPCELVSRPGATRNSEPDSGDGGCSLTSSGPHQASSRCTPPL